MRKQFGPKPMLCPEMALVIGSYDEDGTPNAMVAAWGGISDDQEVSICLGNDHQTTINIVRDKCFTLSVGSASAVHKIDYVGVVSGKVEKEKVFNAGFIPEKADKVNAPLFEELPVSMECELISYDPDSCRLVGKIVGVSVNENLLDEEGNLSLEKFKPLVYDPFSKSYLEVNRRVAKAFVNPKKNR